MSFVNPVNAVATNTFIMEAVSANEIYKEMHSKEIDLEKVEDRRVTCFSWSKAYTKLINELLGLNAFCAKNIIGTHAWAMMGHKADATEQCDLSRVKMNLSTYGYTLSTNKKLYIPD